ncbi:MAG: MarR family winged helix-turn-helix transcriptional regulator [Acidimicrobiales bacterium]
MANLSDTAGPPGGPCAQPGEGAGADERGRPLAERLAVVMRLLRVCSSRSEIAGLSNARYEFLHLLVHGGPMRMGAAAKELSVSARTVTPMVDALEGDGLLVRSPDPTDRRAVMLSLTAAGLRLMRQVHDERIAMAANLFAPLDQSEQAALGALLDKIIAAAHPRQRPPPSPTTRPVG